MLLSALLLPTSVRRHEGEGKNTSVWLEIPVFFCLSLTGTEAASSEAGLMMLAYGGKQKFRGQKTAHMLEGETTPWWGRALAGFFCNAHLAELTLKEGGICLILLKFRREVMTEYLIWGFLPGSGLLRLLQTGILPGARRVTFLMRCFPWGPSEFDSEPLWDLMVFKEVLYILQDQRRRNVLGPKCQSRGVRPDCLYNGATTAEKNQTCVSFSAQK